LVQKPRSVTSFSSTDPINVIGYLELALFFFTFFL
jgi:hypothetical protein